MERRKAYILTTLIILTLITGLSFWYLYTAKQELAIGQVTELELYGVGEQSGRPDTPRTTSTNGFGTTNPVKNSQTTQPFNTIIQPKSTTDALTNTAPKPQRWQLLQLHTDPVTGARLQEGVVLFTEQKTGHVFTSDADGVTERVSGSTIQHVRSAHTFTDGSVLLLRNDNKTPLLMSFNTGTATTTESTLSDEILQITNATPATNNLYYITPHGPSGVALKSTSDSDSSALIWTSPLSGWLLQAISDTVLMVQKPSYNIPGYAYTIPLPNNPNFTQQPQPVAQDLPGLIARLSPSGSQLLYSTAGKDGITLYLKDLSTMSSIPLSIKTLASKCTWSPDDVHFYCGVPSVLQGALPDTWYKGQTHFSDSLWRINSQTGDALELAHATSLDIIELQEDGDMLVFKNKTDQSLWSVIKE